MANDMRQTYRELAADEQAEVLEIKAKGQALHDAIELCGPLGAFPAKDRALARVQEAVMWAVKHITGDA